MSQRTLSIVLAVPLLVLTVLAVRGEGLRGFLQHHQSWGGIQVFTDLVILALLACMWMLQDGRSQGRKAWPFVVLTLVAGSFGPLAYFGFHPRAPVRPGVQAAGFTANPWPAWARPLAGAVTLLFAALTARALVAHGYFGIWRLQFASWSTLQVLADLAILCLLASIFMVQDSRRRGRPAWPFLLLTGAAGSFGPLAYLLVRGGEAADPPA